MIALSIHPSSASETSSGHGIDRTRAEGTESRSASSYAPERTVPSVPMTPIVRFSGKAAARRTHGSTIPTTGIL